MAFTPTAAKQQNIAINEALKLAFFEGSELCYNYRTQQWTSCSAYLDLGFYSIRTKGSVIGIVRFSAGSVHLQPQGNTYVPQTAVITTGATDPNVGGRVVVTGVRPLVTGGTHTIRVGTQDSIGGTVTYTAQITPNTRSGMANMRAEGRYVRVENTIAGGFTTALGADVEFAANGKA